MLLKKVELGLLAHIKLLLSSLFAKAFSFDKLCELYKLQCQKLSISARVFPDNVKDRLLATLAGR